MVLLTLVFEAAQHSTTNLELNCCFIYDISLRRGHLFLQYFQSKGWFLLHWSHNSYGIFHCYSVYHCHINERNILCKTESLQYWRQKFPGLFEGVLERCFYYHRTEFQTYISNQNNFHVPLKSVYISNNLWPSNPHLNVNNQFGTVSPPDQYGNCLEPSA